MTSRPVSVPTPMTSVRQRILRGLSANAYSQLVTVIVQLAGVPILLHAWGTQLYGEWLILFAIPAYLAMADLGFSQSAGNDMAARVARSDQAGAVTVFHSLMALVYLIAIAGVLLSAVLLWYLPLDGLLSFSVVGSNQALLILWLFAAEVFIRLVGTAYHAGFRAGGEYALSVSLIRTVYLLQFAGVWGTALAGYGPVAAAAAYAAVRIIATLMLATLLNRRHAWLHLGIERARIQELRSLVRPAFANMAVPLAQALNIQGMVLVVGAVLGPVSVVMFSTLRTLTRLALQLVRAVSHTVEPEIAFAYGNGNQTLIKALFVHAMRGGLWLAVVAAGSLGLFGEFIVNVWTHNKVAVDDGLLFWLLVSAVASVFWYTPLFLLRAANQHLPAALVFVFGSAAAVGAAWVLLSWTGQLECAGMALLVMDATMALYTLGSIKVRLNISVTAALGSALDPRPLFRLAQSRCLPHSGRKRITK